MPKLIFNPPPGWMVQEAEWLPGPSWDPPEDWPPIPPGWPLFYIERVWPGVLVWYGCVIGLVAGFGWLMSAAGTPLTKGSYCLVGICMLASIISSRVGVLRAAPLTKWTWLPHRPSVTPSAVSENPPRR